MKTNMKKTIYIHIGTEKTGTKTIQNFCCRNNEFLKKNDLYYPYNKDKKYMFNITHWPLAASLTKNNKFIPQDKMVPAQEMYDLFKEDIEKVPYNNILISAEPFSVNVTNKKSLLNLKSYLADYNVKIIVYLRRQDNYFVSLTSTKIKGGVHDSSAKFSTNEIFSNKERYDYFNLVSKWADVFGENNIIVKSFERETFINKNIIDDFFGIFNITVSEQNNSTEDNISLSLESLYFMNIVNGTYDLDNKERTKIYSLLEQRENKYKIKNLISPKERYDIIKHYESSNTKVAMKYLGKDDGILFNESIPSPNDKWDKFKGLTTETVFEIFNYVLHSKYGQESNEIMIDILIKDSINEILNNPISSKTNVNKDKETRPLFYSLENNLLEKGNMISSFKKEESEWTFISNGDDPHFMVPNFVNYNDVNELFVRIKITVPEDTMLQIFYKSKETSLNQNQSIKKNVKKGQNSLNIHIRFEVPITEIRLDPGTVEGEYVLHKFEIRDKVYS